jgi:hypothetical protein
MNLDLDAAVVKRRIQISELEEMRLKAYENASIYKEIIKRWYDKRLKKKEIRSSSTIHYGKQGIRREQKSLARASPRALGEELFTESKKILGEDKNSR